MSVTDRVMDFVIDKVLPWVMLAILAVMVFCFVVTSIEAIRMVFR